MIVSETISIIRTSKEKLRSPQEETGKAINKKLQYVLAKNKGFQILEKICNNLDYEQCSRRYLLFSTTK